MAPSSFHSMTLLVVLVTLLAVVPSSRAAGEVVRKVCRRARDYEYCVNALNSDPRAPDADRYLLAYISFGMAFTNASSTLDYVSGLLKSGGSNDTKLADGLKECRDGYKKGVAAMVSANNDLNSETYYYLAEYADTAASGADVCRAALTGTHRPPPGLSSRNRDMKSLCEICSLIKSNHGEQMSASTNSFTGPSVGDGRPYSTTWSSHPWTQHAPRPGSRGFRTAHHEINSTQYTSLPAWPIPSPCFTSEPTREGGKQE